GGGPGTAAGGGSGGGGGGGGGGGSYHYYNHGHGHGGGSGGHGSRHQHYRQVTSLCWNPDSTDLFAVGYGSYDFARQGGGMIACFTLKNPSYPEYLFLTESGVMCLDFHPQHPSLIAVGFYDGSVAVYNLRGGLTGSGVGGAGGTGGGSKKGGAGGAAAWSTSGGAGGGYGYGGGYSDGGGSLMDALGMGGGGGGDGGQPVWKYAGRAGIHTDPVWQVCWQKDDLDNNPNFFSVSSDGRITQWTILKNEIVYTDVIKLRYDEITMAPSQPSHDQPQLQQQPNGGLATAGAKEAIVSTAAAKTGAPAVVDDDEKLFGLASGCCFDFHKKLDHLFVVGTEEGKIYKCSKAYSSQYLMAYEGHQMAVYTVRYNPFCHEIFASASADWTVKLWHHDHPAPLMTFDLNGSIGDVAWAPYSSTVFAAVTAEGKVYVFDLQENKYNPMCEQAVVRKAKLTHITFNPFDPVILVGDDKGAVVSLKLSPNLRKTRKLEAEEQALRMRELLGLATHGHT
ncbi:hypothetical protein HK102_007808, partial [Quaeritorhiza haematococci]